MEDGVRGVSVVICVYTEERWDDILAAVESLRQQTCPPQEIIIIVDHNPALLERVRAHIHDVVAVENREMRGLSGGRNTGISVARGDLIAFLDDDAVAAPDWLARLSSLCREPAVLGAGGAVDPMWIGERPDWFPEEFNWVVGCTYRGLPERRAPVRNLLGGCSCFRREIFETVGGFRNGIGRVGTRPVGGEETELCIRAHQHWPDRIWLYEPAARVAHRVPPQRATWAYFRARCFAEGRSKALITRLVGQRAGLASERAYVWRTLPRGVGRELRAAVVRREGRGLVRAGAIVAGPLITAAGYLNASVAK